MAKCRHDRTLHHASVNAKGCARRATHHEDGSLDIASGHFEEKSIRILEIPNDLVREGRADMTVDNAVIE